MRPSITSSAPLPEVGARIPPDLTQHLASEPEDLAHHSWPGPGHLAFFQIPFSIPPWSEDPIYHPDRD